MKRSFPKSAGSLGLAAMLFLTGCRDAERALAADPGVTNAVAAGGVPGQDTRPVHTLDVARRPLPPGVEEVIKLAESGATEEVQRAFVETSADAYSLSVDDMIYLRDIGVPSSVVAAMLKRGNELRENEAAAAEAQAGLQSAVDQLRAELSQPAAVASAPPEPSPEPGAVATEVSLPDAAALGGNELSPEASQFYSELAPYGSWNFVPVHGWVWQPQAVVVNPRWRPYCDSGRWVWSNAGWYWASDYSWGWAPFHFGRWYQCSNLGWAWVPGRVWGPSWVSWRWNAGHCGWAPLPPACGWSSGVGLTWSSGGVSVGVGWGLTSSCWNFVPWNSFCSATPWRHTVAVDQSGSIYQNSTVVNNIIVGDNNTIINEGLGLARVKNLAGAEVPRVSVRDLPDSAGRVVRADRVERTSDGPVVYRPSETRFAETGRIQPTSGPATDARSGGGSLARNAVAAPSPTGNLPSLTTPSRPGMTAATPGPAGAGNAAAALRRPGVQPASSYNGTPVASVRPATASAPGNALPRSSGSTRPGLVAARPATEARNATPVTQARPIGGDARTGHAGQRTTYPTLGQSGRTAVTEARTANPVTTSATARDPRSGQPLAVASTARTPQVAGRPAVTTARPATAPRVQVEARQTMPTTVPQASPRPTAPATRSVMPQAPVYSSRPEARSYSAPVRQAMPTSVPRPVVNAPVSAPRPMVSAPSAAVSMPVSRPSVSPAPAPSPAGGGASGRGFQPR